MRRVRPATLCAGSDPAPIRLGHRACSTARLRPAPQRRSSRRLQPRRRRLLPLGRPRRVGRRVGGGGARAQRRRLRLPDRVATVTPRLRPARRGRPQSATARRIRWAGALQRPARARRFHWPRARLYQSAARWPTSAKSAATAPRGRGPARRGKLRERQRSRRIQRRISASRRSLAPPAWPRPSRWPLGRGARDSWR